MGYRRDGTPATPRQHARRRLYLFRRRQRTSLKEALMKFD